MEAIYDAAFITNEQPEKPNGRRAPAQKPGRSVQSVQTPPEFIAAVKQMLGVREFTIDLAADAQNTQAPRFYTEADNALMQPWPTRVGEWNWLNPPFAKLAPWLKKAQIEALHGANTAVLVPAGVGSNWFRDHVLHSAVVLFLNGRLTFVGHTSPYPKDLMLLLYGPMAEGRGDFNNIHVWNWRIDAARAAEKSVNTVTSGDVIAAESAA